MKQSRKCSKCASTEIWTETPVPDRAPSEHLGDPMTKLFFLVQKRIGRKRKQSVAGRYVVYVCMDCGYTERYVDSKGLELIRERGAR